MGRCLLESLELQDTQPVPRDTSLSPPITATAKKNHAWPVTWGRAGEGREEAHKLGVGQANTRVHPSPTPLRLLSRLPNTE